MARYRSSGIPTTAAPADSTANQRMPFPDRTARRSIRIPEHQRGRLDLGDGRRRIGEAGLDDRKGAGLAERIEQIGRRSLGDHDHRTQERHQIRRLQGGRPMTLGERC